MHSIEKHIQECESLRNNRYVNQNMYNQIQQPICVQNTEAVADSFSTVHEKKYEHTDIYQTTKQSSMKIMKMCIFVQ